MPGSLFHNFPRGLTGDAQKLAGLKTLEGFLKLGLVLAPETVELSEQLQNGEPGRKLTIGQKRFCFTELSEDMIRAHSDTFGAFSIEFDLDGLSRAGATPVFYFPPAHSGGAGGLAAALIMQLGDVANLVKDLAELKDQILPLNGRDIIDFEWGDPPNQFRVPVTVSAVSVVLSYLEYKNGAARTLHNSLRGISQFFYPTHEVSKEALGYYRQREWRIIGDIAMNGQLLMRNLIQEEKDFLVQCNPRFFEREVDLLSGRCVRVDECRLYMPPGEAHGMNLARRIICPADSVSDAQALLKEYNFDLPVTALEDLPLRNPSP